MKREKKDGKEKKSVKIYLQSLDIARSIAMDNKVTVCSLYLCNQVSRSRSELKFSTLSQ